jgi:hypothetical protein
LVGTNGAVRHGAECFNFYFPQELDQEFLVISETLLGPTTTTPWKYMNVSELQDALCQKIDEGFTFPLNPKWVLCDDGWKKVYDKLLASQFKNVQSSIDCWYPPNSGVRERIEDIYSRHPQGFQRAAGGDDVRTGTCTILTMRCTLLAIVCLRHFQQFVLTYTHDVFDFLFFHHDRPNLKGRKLWIWQSWS